MRAALFAGHAASAAGFLDSAAMVPAALGAGKHAIVFDFARDGPGFAKSGTGVAKVDGQEVANQKISHAIPALVTTDEAFDVAGDTRTPVDDSDCRMPFRRTGTIDRVTFKLGRSKPSGLDAESLIRLALAKDRA